MGDVEYLCCVTVDRLDKNGVDPFVGTDRYINDAVIHTQA
jgi:hypothetical protein